MAFRQEEFTFTTSAVITSRNLSFDAAVAANSLLIAIINTVDGPNTKSISSVTDSLGNTWTSGINAVNTAGLNHCGLSLWYCLTSAAGACTVTINATPAGSATTWWYVAEFDPVTAVDTSSTNSISLDTTAGALPFPYGASGSQTAPGLMIAIGTNNPQASSFTVPSGFSSTGLITSANRNYYRYSSVAEDYADVISTMQSSSAGNLDAALGVISFLTATSDEIVDNLESICCSEGDPGTVSAGGGQSHGADPFQTPLIGDVLGCVGGGLVPTQADIVWAETWWG